MKNELKGLFRGVSSVLFLPGWVVGIVVVSVLFLRPNIGLGGVLSLGGAYLFSRLVDRGGYFSRFDFNVFNAFLVGLGVGYLFRMSVPVMLLSVVLGILTYVVAAVVSHVFYTYLKLPCLSLPFVITGGILYLAAVQYPGLTAAGAAGYPVVVLDGVFPVWLSGFFKSLGAVFFMPHVLPGMVLAGCILVVSRILFFLSLLGYVTGVVFSGLLVGSFASAFSDINQFNSILTAAAIGGIYLVPSRKSYLIAVIAVGASTVFLHSVFSFWWFTRIPGFPLAFNFVTLGFIYTLGILGYPGLARVIKPTPEQTLDVHLLNRDRPSIFARTLMLPFSGKWTVLQGFDGKWTHRGNWKYAYDFIITDQNGNSFNGPGDQPKDYYAFGKPVLSPVSGVVAAVANHFPDNPVDEPDTVNNWGNYVIIRDDRMFYVEISHFVQGSIKVKEGDRVERGFLLGLCGNSGFSRQPHIHIQVQYEPVVGAHTVPFCFSSYANDSVFRTGDVPDEGAIVEPLFWDPATEKKTIPPLDEEFCYSVIKNGTEIDRLNLTVHIAPDGTRYFDSGRGKLYFGQHSGMFYFYGMDGNDPYLKTMQQALPAFPLAARPGLEWKADLPPGIVFDGWKKNVLQWLSSFSSRWARVRNTLISPTPGIIKGQLYSKNPALNREVLIEQDNRGGFSSFKVGSMRLRRMN